MDTILDDPRYTIDALVALQASIVRLNETIEIWKGDDPNPKMDEIDWLILARQWDGLDLAQVVSTLREATHMIKLLYGETDMP